MIGHSLFKFDNDHHRVQSWSGHDWGGYAGSLLICGSVDCRHPASSIKYQAKEN